MDDAEGEEETAADKDEDNEKKEENQANADDSAEEATGGEVRLKSGCCGVGARLAFVLQATWPLVSEPFFHFSHVLIIFIRPQGSA
jgi:hypothetical protein